MILCTLYFNDSVYDDHLKTNHTSLTMGCLIYQNLWTGVETTHWGTKVTLIFKMDGLANPPPPKYLLEAFKIKRCDGNLTFW